MMIMNNGWKNEDSGGVVSGEPKTLTPGLEAKLTVTQVNALVIAIKECWEFAHGHGFGPHREGKAAMEALRAAFPFSFGVRVVARDEAAELRAAIREWSKANRACSQWVSGTGTDDESPLQRLSRAERELHALAATEGES